MIKLLLLIIYIFTISLEYGVDDTIIELVTKNYYLYNANSFKILKYIPSCENTDTATTKNIYIQINTNDFYLYNDFSDIKQNEEYEFINYNEKFKNNSNLINVICGKQYYIVYFVKLEEYSTRPGFSAQITILNEDENIIHISPLLSNYFSFYQKLEKEEKFYYFFSETKYALISFITIDKKSKIKIIENDNIIYENDTDTFNKIYEFKKNTNYTIIYKAGDPIFPINFQFYIQPKFFNHDFKREPAIIQYNNNLKYYFDIDISDYLLGENIVFYLTGRKHNFGYQFKNDFKENNFIYCDTYHNYILIKKTKDDSSLIIYFQYLYNNPYYSMINLVRPEEIKSDYNAIIRGPKLFLIEYYILNGMNSIGIEADESFFLYEQEFQIQDDIQYELFDSKYLNLYITKQNNLESYIFKGAFIYFNSTNNINFRVQKFNFPIFSAHINARKPQIEYFDLCQGNNSPKELYFYYDSSWYEIFSSVFGDFNSYFINENDLQSISDLNFEQIEKNNFNYFTNNNGYLKINCTNPLMLKHSNADFMFIDNLNAGQRYNLFNCKTEYKFNNDLINQTITLKFTPFGLRSNETFELIFNNGESYDLNNTSLETNYTFTDKNENGFYFKCEGEEHKFLVEVKVGFLSEQFNKDIEIKDLEDVLGTSNTVKKGIIIKVPKKFDENLYDFSIIFSNYIYKKFDIDILYDNLQYVVPIDGINFAPISPIIPLFKVNPYNYIYENNDNKFLYILIYFYDDYEKNITIKKPKILNDAFKFNTINPFPTLTDKKYYYQIKIPKEDYNSLLIETIYTWWNQIKMTLSKDYIQYPINHVKNGLYSNKFIINKDNSEKDLYLNYYDTDYDYGYINFVKNIYSFKYNSLIYSIKAKAEQIEGKNKIKINLVSFSYYYYPVKYYIIINAHSPDRHYRKFYESLYPIITNKKKINKENKEFMTIIEDKGNNEIFECEIDIDIELKDSNYITFIPVRKENNLLEVQYIMEGNFAFNYINNANNSSTLVIVFIIIIIILVIISAIIIYRKLRKKKLSSIDINEPILNDIELK